MKNKFRASFSVLRLWEQGRYEDAVRAYFKLEQRVSESMVMGKQYHEDWAEEIRNNNCLPEVFGSHKLKSPIVEKYMTAEIFDWLTLSGLMDCYDDGVIYEFKTGISSAMDYARTMQIAVYGVLATLNELPITQARIYRYDQYNKQCDMVMVWITDEVIEKGFKWIEANASEMFNYLVENKLYEKFGDGTEDGKTKFYDEVIE